MNSSVGVCLQFKVSPSHESPRFNIFLHAKTVHLVMALRARLCLFPPGPLKKITFSLHRDTWNIPQNTVNPPSSEGCLTTCQWPTMYWLPQKLMSENIKVSHYFLRFNERMWEKNAPNIRENWKVTKIQFFNACRKKYKFWKRKHL